MKFHGRGGLDKLGDFQFRKKGSAKWS